MSGPFEVVGGEAPVCVDGVCALPADAPPINAEETLDTETAD